MVAQVVEALGFNLGPHAELRMYTHEDQTMHSPNFGRKCNYVAERNAGHPFWGWKDPIGITSVQQMLFCLRNPHVIVVFRDLLASIQGEMRYDQVAHPETCRPFEDLVDRTVEWWTNNMVFVKQTNVPTILVSYERAITNPEGFVKELAQFLGVGLTREVRGKALSRISKTGGYLQ